eukprot:6075759-Pyramimonas_sp.AAC.1
MAPEWPKRGPIVPQNGAKSGQRTLQEGAKRRILGFQKRDPRVGTLRRPPKPPRGPQKGGKR